MVWQPMGCGSCLCHRRVAVGGVLVVCSVAVGGAAQKKGQSAIDVVAVLRWAVLAEVGGDVFGGVAVGGVGCGCRCWLR